MREEHFNELVDSVKEMNAICNGQKKPSREFVYSMEKAKPAVKTSINIELPKKDLKKYKSWEWIT